jgi:hypothetical protein
MEIGTKGFYQILEIGFTIIAQRALHHRKRRLQNEATSLVRILSEIRSLADSSEALIIPLSPIASE